MPVLRIPDEAQRQDQSRLPAIALRFYQGLKRVKTVFWWCNLHVEHPRSMADALRHMPTDADVDLIRDRYGVKSDSLEKPEKRGESLVWEELHHKTRYPYAID